MENLLFFGMTAGNFAAIFLQSNMISDGSFGRLFSIITLAIFTGAIAAYAFRNVFANLVGGVILRLHRSFRQGDQITVGGYEGRVDRIGLLYSWLRTADDTLVMLPNAEATTHTVENTNDQPEEGCRATATVQMPPRVDIEAVKEIAYQAAISSRYVQILHPVRVRVSQPAAQSSRMQLRISSSLLDSQFIPEFQSEMMEQLAGELV